MEESKNSQPTAKQEFQPFPADQTEILLVNDDGVTKESLKLDEIDPIFAESFKQMIKDHFAQGKHFFVAKIRSSQINWASAATTTT